MSAHNRNPTGNNQYGHVRKSRFRLSPSIWTQLLISADIDDEKLTEALKRYHREGKTSNVEIKDLLKHELDYDLRCVEYSIKLSY